MRTSYKFKSSLIGLSAAIMACTAAPALAEDGEESSNGISVSANVALTSDYRFRGLSFSDGDIAVQGGIDVSHDSGFYIGTWASSIEDSATFGHTELDLYGGWSGEVTSGLSVDVGLLYYAYPNGQGGAAGPSDYFEPYASVTGAIGPVEVTSGVAWAPSQDSLGNDDNVYIYTGISGGIPNTPISLNATVGINDGSLGNPTGQLFDDNYVDWKIGADWAITDKLTASLAYTDTDAPSVNNFTDSAVVFTIAAEF